MKEPIICEFESNVVASIKSGRWSDAVRAHAVACPHCKETVTIMSAMEDIASTATKDARWHDPKVIWLRARFARREERVSKLDLFMLLGMSLIAVVGSIIAIYSKFPEFVDRLGRVFGGLPLSSFSLPVIVVAGVLLLMWMFMLDAFLGER